MIHDQDDFVAQGLVTAKLALAQPGNVALAMAISQSCSLKAGKFPTWKRPV